ncbi:sensor histidine kinase [Nocardioides conyzicola]|uniref:Oxygen sensor histidine kinase NreB n=1 Tax=Nocardioides conyzicola TaxID=1651781 RepID=A0ABP8X7J5_9ACTN
MSTVAEHRQPWRLSPQGQVWFDIVLATGLLLPALAMPFTEAGWTGFAVSVGQLAPLYWRRRHPVVVFAVVAGSSAAQALLLDTPLWSQVAFPVAVYSVARFSHTRAGLAALATGIAGAFVASYVWLLGFDQLIPSAFTSYVLFITAIVVTAWALGTLGRIRRAYVDALVERGEQIRREAAQEIALAASDERARIAREMHDVVAHGLSMIVVQADGARYAAERDPAVATETLETIAATGRASLTEMRHTLGLLRSGGDLELRPQPGIADLAGIVVGDDIDATLPDPATTAPDGVALTAYRIVQEALTNVRKHAGPDVRVRVVVAVDDEATVLVEDDGRGAAVTAAGGGLGLLGMRERVQAHGGTLEAGPRAGGGWRVAARLPL